MASAHWTWAGCHQALQLCERFFTTAGPAVIAELHAFRIAEGVHPPPRRTGSPTARGVATYHPEPGE
jgi:hypothetical protein